MENMTVDLFQLNENSNVTVVSSNKSTYVSFIKIHGRPILPPVITEEKRNELNKFKQLAVERELQLAKLKEKGASKVTQISSEISSIDNVPPYRQSTPARPITLNLSEKISGKTFVLSKSKTEVSLDKLHKAPKYQEVKSSQISGRQLDRVVKSTLEQRIANEEGVIVRNKQNKYQRSPIIEELPDKFADVDYDSKKERKRWSPLKIDSINSLRIELPDKDSQETDDNLETSLDESQNTPETVTQSPNLLRQNSYTLLTPSPALLNFLESQKEQECTQRPQSGRKTWDLNNAKKKWDPNSRKICKSPDEDFSNDDSEFQSVSKKNSSSLDSFSCLQNSNRKGVDYNEYSAHNSLDYDSGTSPDSYSSKLPKPKTKIKLKKPKETKNLSSIKSVDKVPSKNNSVLTQGMPHDYVPSGVTSEISELSNLLLKMKVDHEKQKKELEEKQQSEMKQLEIMLQRKAELLSQDNTNSKKSSRSIYSHTNRDRSFRKTEDARIMGDGKYSVKLMEKNSLINEQFNHYVQSRRPHSAKDFHSRFYYENDCNRRTRSMDFNQGNQDTDVDFSFQDDCMHSKDATLNNEFIIESDSVSNFSSHSSTISSENRHDYMLWSNLKKFKGISSEDYAKYNQAAIIITAAARGFLTRRLLRTAHVQGLIRTLRDAINCATQLHTASDIADSDIDLMRRLGRQIEAAWDAVYAVFFNTETSCKLQLIAADRERLKAVMAKTGGSNVKKKRISSATEKSLNRKKGGSIMSKSQTSNGFGRVRMCSKMAASYPSPSFPQKLK